ncbi:MAG TPA: hypothetical protein VJK54_03555 [Chthoniobacterales bacterium]|nr:hypothetical protein [Chthoniobacterales bacterium]
MKIFHLFLLSVLISPACIFAQDKNRLEETNQVTSCRLQVTNQVIGCRLQVVGANQAADHTVGRRSTELPLVDLSFQIDRGGKTTTNCELRTTNCDNLGQDLSCHLMMDPAELKNIEEGVDALRGVITTKRTVAEGEVAEASSVRARGSDVASDVNCCELSIYSPLLTLASLKKDFQTVQEKIPKITEQIKAAKQASKEKRGGEKAYFWDRIAIKLEQSRDSWNKVNELVTQGKHERAFLWRKVAEESEVSAEGMRQVIISYISGQKEAAEQLERQAWNTYYLSDASTWLLKSKEALEKADQIQAGRLLSKLAYADEVQGVDGAQKLSVQELLDASSTGATKQFAAEIEFRKESNGEGEFWRRLAEHYKIAADYEKKALEAHHLGKEDERNSWVLAGKSAYASADYQVKAIEAEAVGKITLAAGYRDVAAISQRAADQWKLSAERKAAREISEAYSWGNAGMSLQSQADYQAKVIEAEEAGKITLAAGYREAAATFQRAAEQNKLTAETYVAGKMSEAYSWGKEAESLRLKAGYQAKACEAEEAGKAMLVASYREAVVISQRAADQWKLSAETEIAGKEIESNSWGKEGESLQKQADYYARASEAEEAEETQFAAGYREAATIVRRAAIQHRKSAQAYATEKKDEGDSWKRVGKFLQSVVDYQVKACEAQEEGKTMIAVGYREAIEILQKAADYQVKAIEAIALGKKDESDGWDNVAMFLESKGYDRIRRAHADEVQGVAGIQNVSVQRRYSNSMKRIALSLCCEKWLAETKSAEGSDKILSDYVIDVLKRGAYYKLVKDFEKYWSYVAKAHEFGDDPQALAWIQVAENVQQAIEASIIKETASRNNIELNEAWNATLHATWKMAKYRAQYIQIAMCSQGSEIVSIGKKVVEQSQAIAECYRKAAEACSLGNEREPNWCNSAVNSMEKSVSKLDEAVEVRKKSTEARVAGNILLADGYLVEAKKLEHAAELMIQSTQAYVEGREFEGISLSWAGKYTGESSAIMIKAFEAQGPGNSILEVKQITKAKELEQEAEKYKKAATVKTRVQEAKEKESASIGAISSTWNEVVNSLEKATEYWDKAIEACRFNKTPMGEKYIVVAETYEQAAEKYDQVAKIRTKGTCFTGVEEIEREGKALEEEAEVMIQKIEEKSVPIPPTSRKVKENWGEEID